MSCRRKENKSIRDGLKNSTVDKNSFKGRQAAVRMDKSHSKYERSKAKRAVEAAKADFKLECGDDEVEADAKVKAEPVDEEDHMKS